MVGILLSYWGGLVSGATLVSGRVVFRFHETILRSWDWIPRGGWFQSLADFDFSQKNLRKMIPILRSTLRCRLGYHQLFVSDKKRHGPRVWVVKQGENLRCTQCCMAFLEQPDLPVLYIFRTKLPGNRPLVSNIKETGRWWHSIGNWKMMALQDYNANAPWSNTSTISEVEDPVASVFVYFPYVAMENTRWDTLVFQNLPNKYLLRIGVKGTPKTPSNASGGVGPNTSS